MATGGADPVTELCEEQLSCDVCSEEFDYDACTPIIIPFFHSFCKSCLKQITKDGKCQCPKCRNEITVSGRIAMDTTRMKVMDKKSALQSQGGVSCGGCPKGAKTTSRCQDSEDFLCEFCSPAHFRMDERKKEMLSLWEELAKAEQSFQAKAEESEASVEAVESNLDEAVHKVEAVFSEIITSATDRQAEIIGGLRAKAKSDKLLLGEQSTTFRSLQTAAQFGRKCVALSLVSQVFSQTPELKKTVQQLREKRETPVQPASSYVVMTDKLAELQALMKKIGEIETRFVPRGVTLPSIQLDTSRCGSGCWVGADHCSLSNQPCSRSHSQPQSQSFRFPGTCGTKALPGNKSYWQVRAVATGKPKINNDKYLCEFGVATQQALQACPGDHSLISNTEHCALTVGIYNDGGHVQAVARYGYDHISTTALAPFSPHKPVDVTLGLLLDTDTSRVRVIDVRATRVLCSSAIDLPTLVWPAVRVESEDGNGARVDVEVQSGQQIEMSRDLIRLLQSML